MSFYIQPVGQNTFYWGLLVGSVSSAYIRARATLDYSPETRLEFARQFLPSLFETKKNLLWNAIFLGSCWTVSRIVTELGFIATGRSFFHSNDQGDEEKNRGSICLCFGLSIFFRSLWIFLFSKDVF